MRKLLVWLTCALLLNLHAAALAQTPTHDSHYWQTTLRRALSDGHHYYKIRLLDGRTVRGDLTDIEPAYCTVTNYRQHVVVTYDQIQSAQWPAFHLNRAVKVGVISLAVLTVAMIFVGLELRKA